MLRFFTDFHKAKLTGMRKKAHRSWNNTWFMQLVSAVWVSIMFAFKMSKTENCNYFKYSFLLSSLERGGELGGSCAMKLRSRLLVAQLILQLCQKHVMFLAQLWNLFEKCKYFKNSILLISLGTEENWEAAKNLAATCQLILQLRQKHVMFSTFSFLVSTFCMLFHVSASISTHKPYFA